MGRVVGAAVAGGAVALGGAPVVGAAVVPAGVVVDAIVRPVVVAIAAVVVLVDVLSVLEGGEVVVNVSSGAEVGVSTRAAETSSVAALVVAERSPPAQAVASVTTSATLRHRPFANRMGTVSARCGAT